MKHEDIYKVYPEVVAISGDACYDKDGGLVEVSLSFVQQTIFKLELEEAVKVERNRLLANTDWWALGDISITPEQKAYRQALRDVPAQAGFPDNVTWPERP